MIVKWNEKQNELLKKKNHYLLYSGIQKSVEILVLKKNYKTKRRKKNANYRLCRNNNQKATNWINFAQKIEISIIIGELR